MHATAPTALPPDLRLAPVERLLFQGDDVAAAEFQCPQSHPHFHGTGPLENWLVGFPRRASRLCKEGSAPFVADPNTLVFFNPGDVYRREALGDEPDHSDVFALSERTVRACLEEVAPNLGDVVAPRFPRAWAPLAPGAYLRVRRLVDSVSRAPHDDGAAEEAALCTLGSVIAGSAGAAPPRDRAQRRRRARRDLVEDAKAAIAARVGEPLSLAMLAVQVHSSPFHLARSFRALTGSSIHQYVLCQRVSRSLELLRDGVPVCDVALRLGFAAHSHFTETFVRYLGVTPSAYAKRGPGA